MEQERVLPAERLIREALDVYTKQGNEVGMAEAHHAFGNFYKNDLYYTKFAAMPASRHHPARLGWRG